ncbi:hypothetical protein C7476_12428 [Phyllobacterium bourgognense]|uniref:Uncharacterized protein n=1 Tax=Phyllobacterium bourgognense TaxID=314236 RepID=A0A368YHZ9_9HYPH|nr:hypothetical protein C7476_12428 [Phyllobacterium bourgognense]
MKACPEISDYATRGYLGISSSAYEDALDIFG